jgi:autotransporter-associated beta strand protein
MKPKYNPFRSPAIRCSAVFFAYFSMLNPSAHAADHLWTGLAGDNNVTTPGNWTSWVSEGDTCSTWSPFVFGSDVQNGSVNLNRWVAISSIILTPDLTHDITIDNGPIVMGGSLVDMSTAGANLTLNAQLQQAWGDMTLNVGAGRTLTANGGVGESGWFELHTGLTKNGAGTAAITGALGYTLGTTVNGGTLVMPGGSWALNGIANSPITVNSGGTLQLPADPSAYTAGLTLNGGTISSSGVNNSGWPNITLVPNSTFTAGGAAVSTISTWIGFSGNGTFSVGSGSTLNVTGPLTGDWIEARTGFFKTGDGTLTLSSTATGYDCDTTISAGTLEIGGAGQLSGGSYGYNITNNAALVYDSSAYQVLSGAISGSGTLTQNAGTLVLSGANTYTGQTTVNGGFLDIYNTASVGGTSGITVNGAYGIGGQLRFDIGTAGGTIGSPISVIGGAYTWHMSVVVPNSQLTFTGPINVSGGALIVSEGINSTLNVDNAIHGTDGLTFASLAGGAGKTFFVLAGASDFTGNVAIVDWNGSPQVTLSGGDNRLPTTAVVSINGSTGRPGALDLNGNNQTIAGLTDAGGFGGLDAGARCVVNTSVTAATLTLNTTSDQTTGTTVGGTDISGMSGNNLAVVKSGAAKQTLSGANSYSGNTTVTGGILSLGQVNSNNEASSVSITASAGAKLDLAFAGTDTVDSLFINGIQQPAGNYTSAHASGAFTGIGTLQVVSGTAGYASWKAINAPGVGPGTTPGEDYDGDGVSNGVEFVLGGSKDTNDLSLLPTISQSGANMVFSFQRSQTSIDGTTTVAIEVSPDLISWPDSYNVPGPAQVNNPGVTVSKDTSAGFDTVTLTVPRAPDITKFARLVVTPAP